LKNLVFTFVGLAPHFPAQFASRPGLARHPSRASRAVPRPRSGDGHRVATVRRRRPPGGAPAGPTARSPRLSCRQRPASPHSPHSARSLLLAAGSSSHGVAQRRRALRRRVPPEPPHHSPPSRATSTAISRATLLTRSPRESTGGEASP